MKLLADTLDQNPCDSLPTCRMVIEPLRSSLRLEIWCEIAVRVAEHNSLLGELQVWVNSL